MDYYFPIEIIRIIYEYDATYNEVFQKSLDLIRNHKTLPFWCITYHMRHCKSLTGYGKSYMNYAQCNVMCHSLNKPYSGVSSAVHYPRFICDGFL